MPQINDARQERQKKLREYLVDFIHQDRNNVALEFKSDPAVETVKVWDDP